MGQRTAVNAKKRIVRIGADLPLLLVLLTLLVFGILMVYSASWDFSLAVFGDPAHIFGRQLLWLTVGIAAAVFCAYFDYHRWQRLAVPGMMFTIVALVAVLLANEVILGAARSLVEGSYQPSELAKLMIVIYLSVWLYSKRDYLNQVSFGLFPLAAILGLVGGLIFLQPDVSAVLTIVTLGGLLFFLAGGDMRQIIAVFVITLVVGWAVVQASNTGRERIDDYLQGVRNPIEASYHVRRSLEAFVKGGWFGKGIGKADTKLTGLPVPPTDSIYAVIGEETGVAGATVTLVLYGLFLWRGLEIARRAPDMLGALLAGGLSIWISMEAFINMAVMVGLMPFAGNALPFISAGGSNLVVSLVATGIILNVSRLSEQGDRQRANKFEGVIDFQKRRAFQQVTSAQATRTLKPLGEPASKATTRPMASNTNSRNRTRRSGTPRKD